MTTILRGTAGSFWICRVVEMQIWTHSLVVSISLSQSRSPPWTQTSKLHFVSLLKTSYSQGPTDNTSLDDNLFLFDLVNVINFQHTFVFLSGEFHFLKGSSDESDPPISLLRLFSYFYHCYRILDKWYEVTESFSNPVASYFESCLSFCQKLWMFHMVWVVGFSVPTNLREAEAWPDIQFVPCSTLYLYLHLYLYLYLYFETKNDTIHAFSGL